MGGTYSQLFEQDANGLAWDGFQFHGSNGLEYWTAPMNGPTTLVGEFMTPEGGDQTIQGLAFGNGTLYGSDTAGNHTCR